MGIGTGTGTEADGTKHVGVAAAAQAGADTGGRLGRYGAKEARKDLPAALNACICSCESCVSARAVRLRPGHEQ